MARFTALQLEEAGFQPCPQPPRGCQHAGDVYVRRLPKGPAYVLCMAQSEEVEAFIGDWDTPLVYCCWPAAHPQQLTSLLRMAGS